jgi:hypothetical protein
MGMGAKSSLKMAHRPSSLRYQTPIWWLSKLLAWIPVRRHKNDRVRIVDSYGIINQGKTGIIEIGGGDRFTIGTNRLGRGMRDCQKENDWLQWRSGFAIYRQLA